MKIFFDHQLFSYQRYGGASKYFAMLLKNLPKGMWETSTLFSNNEYVRYLKLFPQINLLGNYFFRGQGRIMNELNKPYSIYRLRRKDYDIFHQTHFETYCLKSIGDKPMVTTFHDVNFSTLNPSGRIVKFQKKSLVRADKIIAISENTKNDLIRLFDIDENKISVIYHGINGVTNSQSNGCFVIDSPYILYVGTRRNHKNFDRFIQAFALLHNDFPEIKVVCTLLPFTVEEQKLFKRLGINHNVIQFSANEEMMSSLYRNALFFVFPSLYEGFGMPILEAMSYGCPVVLSNTSCFPEIAQKAGLYFEPTEIDDIYEKMKIMVSDAALRNYYIEEGYKRVKCFSWERCAQQHIEVYKSLL